MRIVQKKYLRTYIALSSVAASLLIGNKVAFAEEDTAAAASLPTEATNPTLPSEKVEEPAASAELLKDEETAAVAENDLSVPTETILDEGLYGTDQLTGKTEPGAYVVVCEGDNKVGEQAADDGGRFIVALGSIPEGTTVLRVKVYKDATQTILLNESDWLVPVDEATEEPPAVDAQDPQAVGPR